MIKRSALFLLSALILNQVSSAEVWSKVLSATHYSTVLNTQYGLILGENDTRVNLNPYNGILISKDVGKSWKNFGLQGRGITDVAVGTDKLFATTFYVKDGTVGLFVSSDEAGSWKNIGPNFSASSVAVIGNTVYLASYNHGLWVSQDGGQNFVQKIGAGFFGPTFNVVRANGSRAIAASAGQTYKSMDNGESWTEIKNLAGKQIKYITFLDASIFAGTYDIDGIYKSDNGGDSWIKINAFGTTPVGSLNVFKGIIYAAKINGTTNKYSLFKSSDYGQSWEDTDLSISSINASATSLGFVYAHPSKIFITFSSEGVYKTDILESLVETFKFLEIPWETERNTDLFDKIYSYFDHEYPLLGYSHKNEPDTAAATTLNFLNVRAPQPELYYSSHSGIDFRLPYGTSVKAPAAGIAEFYNCADCGNSIKIDHMNGYQTTYMHLQKDGLITKSAKTPIQKGDIIGKVGMTGNTTGPHLHFEVTLDANKNGVFYDDFPHGRVDPFGWTTSIYKDPWYGYTWTDAAGKHEGQQSKYLWNVALPQLDALVTPETNLINTDNKSFDVSEALQKAPFNLGYQSYGEPQLPESQKHLKYVPNTSFLLSAINTIESKIETINGKIKIKLDLGSSNKDLDNKSIKLYFYNTATKLWEALASAYDTSAGILSAETTHLSQFAAFETDADVIPPVTVLNVTYNELNEASIEISSSDLDIDKIFYSFGLDEWEEYTAPIKVKNKGTYTFKYRGSDKNGNYEIPNEKIIFVGTKENWTIKTRVSGAQFTIR